MMARSRYASTKIPLLVIGALVGSIGAIDRATAQKSSGVDGPSYVLNVDQCQSEWLNSSGVHLGKNDASDGTFRLIAAGSAEVTGTKQDPQRWLVARHAAFVQAELDARQNIAGFLRTDLAASDRSFEAKENGGESLPPAIEKATEQLSIADKALALTGASLDAEIKKYKPDWDGTGRTEEERHQEIVTIQTRLRQLIEQRARALVSGAITVKQCEGPNADGQYSVRVIAIWSFKTAQIAQSVANPNFALPAAKPEISLEQRFAQLDAEHPGWMALTEGVRIWTDENGKRVIVGFGTAPATSLASIDASRARTRALAAIQYFVAEQIISNGKDKVDFAYRETTNGSKSFDDSSYDEQIKSTAPSITLQGAETISTWRLNHPWSNARMTTVAVKWTADGSQGAAAAQQQINRANAGIPAAPADRQGSPQNGSVYSGASSRPDDF